MHDTKQITTKQILNRNKTNFNDDGGSYFKTSTRHKKTSISNFLLVVIFRKSWTRSHHGGLGLRRLMRDTQDALDPVLRDLEERTRPNPIMARMVP
jgi:hypothetical protein